VLELYINVCSVIIARFILVTSQGGGFVVIVVVGVVVIIVMGVVADSVDADSAEVVCS